MIRLFSSPDEIKLAAGLALKNHLYARGWGVLRGYYKTSSVNHSSCLYVSMWFDGDRPVAICLVWDVPGIGLNSKRGCEVHFYTHPDYRQRGIAKQLFESIKENLSDRNIFLTVGSQASDSFYSGLKSESNVHYYNRDGGFFVEAATGERASCKKMYA